MYSGIGRQRSIQCRSTVFFTASEAFSGVITAIIFKNQLLGGILLAMDVLGLVPQRTDRWAFYAGAVVLIWLAFAVTRVCSSVFPSVSLLCFRLMHEAILLTGDESRGSTSSGWGLCEMFPDPGLPV